MGNTGTDETLRGGSGGQAADTGALAIGVQVAGRYKITRFLGEGGMGAVYAADDLILDTTVAVKTLRPELEGSAVALERFRREMALARKVTSAHVCRLHDVGEHDGRVFLSMELLDGASLAERLRGGGALPADEVERLAAQLVDGLAALHAAGVVHRDLKPGNVMLVGDRAVITDFGLARSIVDRDVALTLETGLLGTPAYMAPEQVEGRAVSPATDVYALGVVLFELITGVLPFREDTALATATARLNRDAPRASSVRPGVPARWDAIIARCLERDPARRPRVREVLDQRPRVSRRWLAVAGLALLAGGGVGAWRVLGADDEVPAAAVTPPAAAAAPADLVAVLPIEGPGALIADPWRVALSIDSRDELATVGIAMLWLDDFPYFETVRGTAAILADDADPSAAAWNIPGVGAVVRMRLATRPDAAGTPITLAVTIERKGQPPVVQQIVRPGTEATLLAHDVASAVAVALGHAPPRRPVDAGSYPTEVYVRYGGALIAYLTGGGDRGRYTLGELVAAEPRLLRAGARLALRLAENAQRRDDEAVLPMAAEATVLADRVLTQDPDQPIALAARGVAAEVVYDLATAERMLERAYQLAPELPRIAEERFYLSFYRGRLEEIRAMSERKDLRNPLAAFRPVATTWMLYYTRHYDEAVRYGRSIVDTLPPEARTMVRTFLGLAHVELGQFEDALAVADQLDTDDDPYFRASAVTIYALCGQRDKAVAVRAQIGDGGGASATALMEDALGNFDAALDQLEQMVDGHHVEALFLRVERYSPALRSQPRFQALMKRVGL